MMGLVDTLATPAAIGILWGIGRASVRRYALHRLTAGPREFAIVAGVTAARGFLAWRNIGGIDTSILIAIAATAAITDLQYGFVFDRMLLAGSAGLAAAAVLSGGAGNALAGAAVGLLALGVPWAVSRARGMGLGDVKLAAVLGCGLGPYGALRAIWLAFVVGAFVAVGCVLLRRRSRAGALPFAPFLALGSLLSLGGAAW